MANPWNETKSEYFARIRNHAFQRGCDYDVANFIAAQSCLETNFGCSEICIDNLNFFGMKMPKFRLTTAFGENRGHAAYRNLHDSFADYLLWCQYYGFSQRHMRNLDAFIAKLRKSPYCPKEDYVDSIIKVFKIYKDVC